MCNPDEFTCKGHPGECVPLTWMCDDNADCTDGSDEKACSKLHTLIYTNIYLFFMHDIYLLLSGACFGFILFPV